MKSRTASTEGQQKGAVAEARANLEQKYQLFRQMLNVASIYEGDADYRPFILAVNAEVEHFRQILARKGVSMGADINSGPGSNENDNDNDNQGGTNQGSGTGTITPTNPDTPSDPGTGGGGSTGDGWEEG